MVLYMAILSEAWPRVNETPNTVDNLKILGNSLLTQYALPFEFASILLLVALIGSVMLAKADRYPASEKSDETGIVESEGNEHVVVK